MTVGTWCDKCNKDLPYEDDVTGFYVEGTVKHVLLCHDCIKTVEILPDRETIKEY